ncbi:MAG: Rne/Rng family ribonuclease [Pararhodobacter sp.]
MGKKLLIDATHAEETRVVVVDGNKVEEFDFETVHRRQLAGNIYLAKVTRVEPSLQAAFVDYGGNRHGFLAFAEIHPDYYQIPTADRQALLEEERALAQDQQDEENGNGRGRRGGRNPEGGGRGRGGAQRSGGNEARQQGAAPQQQDASAADSTAGDTPETGAPAAGAPERAIQESVTQGVPAQGTDAQAAETPATETPVAETPIAMPREPAGETAQTDTNPAAGRAEQQPAQPASDDTTQGDDSAADATDSGQPPRPPIAAPVEGKDPVATHEIDGMEVVDLDDTADSDVAELADPAPQDTPPAPGRRTRQPRGQANRARQSDHSRQSDSDSETPAEADKTPDDEPEPYRAADHATEIDDQIESVADEDVSDEVRPPRRPRSRRYKIQEVIKVRQIMLVQVVKEERGNKGAALTTYLSLAGRYCVLMPNTARGGGISRKITVAADRKKLKEIAGELDVPLGAGLIIRTAGANRTRAEIKRDYEYLSRLWDQIRDLTLQSIAPAPIYAEGDLIKRSIRDLYSREIDEVLVEGEAGYRTAKDFMKMIMPSHARNVKLYNEQLPLFARFQVESYLAAMFNPTVQLKSGGYIVIGVTEALVAIDVNSGKATRQGSIEETALQTNLEAAEEIARQLRLRDLAGLIVIDFIDMEERKNNAAVEKKLKDKLKNDRARIQVGRISGFGLLEMSRQRLRPGMLEATTQPCPHCHGTGLIRSDNSLGLTILRALEEEGTRKRSREVLVRAPVGIVNYLINAKREHLAQIEMRYGMAIRVEADPAMISPDYMLEKFKTATRIVAIPTSPVVSLDAGTMSALDAESDDAADDLDDETETQAEAPGAEPTARADTSPADAMGDPDAETGKPKRRRRRRRRGGQRQDDRRADDASAEQANDDAAAPQGPSDQGTADQGPADQGQSDADRPAHTGDTAETAADTAAPAIDDGQTDAEAAPAAKPARRRRSPRKAADSKPAGTADAGTDSAAAAADGAEPDASGAEAPAKPAPRRRAPRKTAAVKAAEEAAKAAAAQAGADPVAPAPAQETPATPAAAEAVADEPAGQSTPDADTLADPADAPQGAGETTPAAATMDTAGSVDKAAGTPGTETAVSAETAAPETQKAEVDAQTGESPEPSRPQEPAPAPRRGWWSLKG